jgi:signal peptidase I
MAGFKWRASIKYIIIDILLAALLSFFLINNIISAYKIEGNSMIPVLHDQERIIISKLAIKEANLKRFDIVVFYRPDEPEKTLIKRIIGLPSEIVEMRHGDIYINDKLLGQPFLLNEASVPYNIPDGNFPPLLIPRGHYFILGDNRQSSKDSRFFGTVPQKYIAGKAIFRYWPIDRFGKIE